MSDIINEFSIEQIQLMTRAYKMTEILDEFGSSIFQDLISMNATTTNQDVIGKLELLTTDVLGSEKRTKAGLEKFLEILNQTE